MGNPFIGSEALAAGAVNWHQLRTRYRPVFRGIITRRDVVLPDEAVARIDALANATLSFGD